MHGTYRKPVAVSRDVARANFAQLITRVLRNARARGLTDESIKELTGVGPSTFHRWKRGEWGKDWPQIQSVIDFFEGLKLDPDDAFDALGLSGQRPTAAPDPVMDPEFRAVLRRLNDPDVPESEKAIIREMVAYLAQRPTVAGRVVRRGEPGKRAS